MIKAPSIQSEYTLIWSGDPALALPEDADARANALRVARETGNWSPLLAGSPTEFHVRPLTGSHVEWLNGERHRRDLTDLETAALALRLALVRVGNFGDVQVRHEHDEHGNRLATIEVINALYAVPGVGRDIVVELGGAVIQRALECPSPK